MKIIKQYTEVFMPMAGAEMLAHIERCGRVCYKSEAGITAASAPEFVRMILKRGHESVLEHAGFTAKFVTDRGVTHALVRHRLASFSQESTIYCNYSLGRFNGECVFIHPVKFYDADQYSEAFNIWAEAMLSAEKAYLKMIKVGMRAQDARSVLPNSLKTELVVTANLREWRHFFKCRTSKGDHDQTKALVKPLLEKMKLLIPAVFDDINPE